MPKRKIGQAWSNCCVAGLGLALAALTGCQTYVAGMTLPSPHYLEHPPQFIPPSPRFPLPNEQAQQEAVANAPPPGGAPGLPGAPGVVPGGAPQ